MFQRDETRSHLAVEPAQIIALYQSVNTASVALPGVPAAQARAVVVGFREGTGFNVLIGLHLIEAERHLVFGHDRGSLDRDGARTAAKEALAFAEAMGFFVENVNWRELDATAQRETLAMLKVFDAPKAPVRAETAKIVDPRTKLARLLAQF